jgi:hypothetical protein
MWRFHPWAIGHRPANVGALGISSPAADVVAEKCFDMPVQKCDIHKTLMPGLRTVSRCRRPGRAIRSGSIGHERHRVGRADFFQVVRLRFVPHRKSHIHAIGEKGCLSDDLKRGRTYPNRLVARLRREPSLCQLQIRTVFHKRRQRIEPVFGSTQVLRRLHSLSAPGQGAMVKVGVAMGSQGPLPQVRLTVDSASGLPALLHSGQKQGHQRAGNRDRRQQLHEAEARVRVAATFARIRQFSIPAGPLCTMEHNGQFTH